MATTLGQTGITFPDGSILTSATGLVGGGGTVVHTFTLSADGSSLIVTSNEATVDTSTVDSWFVGPAATFSVGNNNLLMDIPS